MSLAHTGVLDQPGAIDKLEVRIPHDVQPRSDFFDKWAAAAAANKVRPSQHYAARGDLREYGHQAIAHFNNLHGKKGDHKLELVDVGEMGYRRIEHEITSLFNVSSTKALENLEVMRVDLCADLHDVTVPWMHERARVVAKRFKSDIDGEATMRMGMGGLQTVYYGKRPNCFRIYDKVAELKAQYMGFRKKWIREQIPAGAYLPSRYKVELTDGEIAEANQQYREWAEGKGATDSLVVKTQAERKAIRAEIEQACPAFAAVFGISPDAVWTRCERQIGGGRVPFKIGSIRRLRQNVANFNPFEKLLVEARGQRLDLSNPNVYFAQPGARFSDWCMGDVVRRLAEQQGMQWAYAFVVQHVGKNNAKRTWERVLPFLPEQVTECDGVTSAAIFEIYQQQVRRQLAA